MCPFMNSGTKMSSLYTGFLNFLCDPLKGGIMRQAHQKNKRKSTNIYSTLSPYVTLLEETAFMRECSNKSGRLFSEIKLRQCEPRLKNHCPTHTPTYFPFFSFFQVHSLCSSLFLSCFNCFFFFFFFSREEEVEDNNKAARAAANGEAVIVNGGIHLETSSVNCAAQYPAPGCSDHQPVTKHTHADTHTELSDHWCSEEERNHTSTKSKTQSGGGEKEERRWWNGCFLPFDLGHRAQEADQIKPHACVCICVYQHTHIYILIYSKCKPTQMHANTHTYNVDIWNKDRDICTVLFSHPHKANSNTQLSMHIYKEARIYIHALTKQVETDPQIDKHFKVYTFHSSETLPSTCWNCKAHTHIP